MIAHFWMSPQRSREQYRSLGGWLHVKAQRWGKHRRPALFFSMGRFCVFFLWNPRGTVQTIRWHVKVSPSPERLALSLQHPAEVWAQEFTSLWAVYGMDGEADPRQWGHNIAQRFFLAGRRKTVEREKVLTAEIEALKADLSRGLNVEFQRTNCCMCGVYKHTPVRNDGLGGYICGGCLETAYGVEKASAAEVTAELAKVHAELQRVYALVTLHSDRANKAEDELSKLTKIESRGINVPPEAGKCPYWSSGRHLTNAEGACLCGKRFAVYCVGRARP